MSNSGMSLATRFQFLLGVVTIVACAPAVENVERSSYESQLYDNPILVFSRNARSACDYEEIATIESRQTHKNVPRDKVNEDLRNKAREIGGDAIVNLVEDQRDVASSYALEGDARWRVSTYRETVVSGTVIRWRDESCSN